MPVGPGVSVPVPVPVGPGEPVPVPVGLGVIEGTQGSSPNSHRAKSNVNPEPQSGLVGAGVVVTGLGVVYITGGRKLGPGPPVKFPRSAFKYSSKSEISRAGPGGFKRDRYHSANSGSYGAKSGPASTPIGGLGASGRGVCLN